MPKSIRIKTETGIDRNINVRIDQDFDFLEILSLKLRQEDVYTRFCADYGVVVGRVVANGGFGVPNAHISVFVPIDEIDENDPVISTLYPYKTPESKNEDGYRYNLLPYEPEYSGHIPTGTFPTSEDVLSRKEVLYVYEKYYKYTVRTNESGDFMIVGVPLGTQNIVMNLDLSNMGEFTLTPNDLLRMGRGIESQFNGPQFKASEDLSKLPQIVNQIKQVNVSSFWGQDDYCDVGITRTDFDLRELGIEIEPTATFMGSIFSSSDEDYLQKNCKPEKETGELCGLVSNPGQILAIRHSLFNDENGEPILEEYKLENDGIVIDENGVFMVDLPMNLEYVYTNEFGQRVISPDGEIGIPTRGRYRFKIKWQNEGGLQKDIQRANYLVPNIGERGTNYNNLNSSYAFSLDWNDYADKDLGIKCEDYFYEFIHNKVYTVASHIDRFKKGSNRSRHLGIKNVNNRECQSEINKFPINDAQRNSDFLYFLLNLVLKIFTPLFYSLIPTLHVLAFIANLFIKIINGIGLILNFVLELLGLDGIPKIPDLKPLNLPMLSYPDCDACSCESTEMEGDFGGMPQITTNVGSGILIDATVKETYSPLGCATTAVGQDVENFLFSGVDSRLLPNMKCGDYADDKALCDALWSPAFHLIGYNIFGVDDHVSFAQSLNLMNQRSRYFTGGSNGRNIIKTEIVNDQLTTPSSSDPFTDLPLIFFVKPDSTLVSGDLLTFGDIENINDPNATGATINQFGNTRITGSTISSQTNYITKTITYIDENGNTQNANVKLFNNIDGKEYDYKSGVEYFQVITGITASVAETLVTGSNSLLSTYIFDKINTYECQSQVNCSTYELHNTSELTSGTNAFFSYTDCNGISQVDTVIPDTSSYVCAQSTPNVVSGPGQVHLISANCGNIVKQTVKPYQQLVDGGNYKILFLNRGVDPWSPKQKIKYDLSKIFGHTSFNNSISVTGEFFLNIPIQPNNGTNSDDWYYDYKTPVPHFLSTNNLQLSFLDTTNGGGLNTFFPSYLFTPESSSWSAFTTNQYSFYSAVDGQVRNSLKDYGSSNGYVADKSNSSSLSTGNRNNQMDSTQDRIEGCSFQFVNNSMGNWLGYRGAFQTNSNLTIAYTVTPIYAEVTGTNTIGPATPKVNMTNSQNIVFRSDRLPSSDTGVPGTIFRIHEPVLHLNKDFSIYKIFENSTSTSQGPPLVTTPDDSSGNSDDLSDSTPGYISGVLGTLSCNGMTALKCYRGSGSNITIDPDCKVAFIRVKKNGLVSGGCYNLVTTPLKTIFADYALLTEWRNRFLMTFAACRGVIGEMFQNNWVNGTLYMPSFYKQTLFDVNGNPRYRYCGSRNNQQYSPIYYNTDSNSFFYRSTRVENGIFNGVKGTESTGSNDRNIFFPTTVMELGPKTAFMKEIMLSPEYDGYIVDKLKSTTYQDTSNITLIFFLSRLLNSNFLGVLLGAGSSSVNSLFSRDGSLFFDERIDGDAAQMYSINSEFGVLPYVEGNYSDSDVFISNDPSFLGGDALMGIWFSADTASRRILTNGTTTFGPVTQLGPTNTFGYPNSQEIPYYKWGIDNKGKLFGSDKNTWRAGNKQIGQGKYQGDNFFVNGTDYAQPANGYGLGYIYNRKPNGDNSETQLQEENIKVGGPFHFYFGLKNGKTAINKFISKYILLD